jgi:hypothetical protein
MTTAEYFQIVDLRLHSRKAQVLQAGITYLDYDIDALVYELYGLTEEEISILEGGKG